ncbi:type II toxin-antitoxin system antitoxin DNA ADP-ribosyl glycohydrolase DarG [Rhodanobacter denitrificans]|uniref:type II toxin-antitoxin system antitoxin DNA ADP-ribosyl glycohydrolase DarG n=1 Tax=Rhodanobacter denitrificans TaxID=666685 RepID=UPI001F476AB7|nr:macro domain-containing protein [Rhodanobacter denitrificans]UJJ59716.1 macro domain-containing protein [Rhodanobacter denitrificans]
MFKALIGDLFTSQARVLVNTVNCVGVMGKGIAQEFRKRYPAMFKDYASRCKDGRVRIGEPYLYRDTAGAWVLNFPTKRHWRSPSRIAGIEAGLDYLAAHLDKWDIRSIALPPLGCGNGGLSWEEVGPLIYRKLAHLPVDVEVYAPYGTPRSQLENDFLASPSQMTLDGKGRRHERANPSWTVLMEVLLRLQRQPYANPVGRTIFQKICYVVTEMGVPTGFQFGKGSYGPFSDDVNPALADLANRNWLHEQPLGRMISLRATPQYENERAKLEVAYRPYERKIAKTVDLFSRIKSTEQAEEVITVLYASRQLKAAYPNQKVSEQQLYSYILEWKKAWDSGEKRLAVAHAIRSLVLLGWMGLDLSDDLPEAA